MAPCRIQVTFQGGGAKLCDLVAAAAAIQELERDKIIEVTRVAGTSAGAITACWYATGKPFSFIRQRLRDRGQHILARVMPQRTVSGALYRVLRGKRRRKRDAAQLSKCIGPCVYGQPFFLHVAYHHEECALLRDWNSSPVPVYFDLGTKEDGTHVFWRRDPISRNGRVYLTPVTRESFLQVHREGLDAEEKFSEGVGLIVEELRRRAAQQSQPLPTPGFQRYRARRRF